MPKLKTNKSVKKRIKITKEGRVKRHRAGRRHLLSKKSGKRKRQLRSQGFVSKSDAKKIKSLVM